MSNTAERIADVLELIPTLVDSYENLQRKFNQIEGDVNKARARRDRDGDSNYKGVFESPVQARDFALWVTAFGADNHSLRDQAVGMLKEFNSTVLRDMSSGVLADGGALVPVEFASRIKDLIVSTSAFMSNAFQMPMGAGETIFPKLVADPEIFLLGQNSDADEDKPVTKDVNLVAKELGCLVKYPQVLEEDSLGAIGELIARTLVRGHANKVEAIGFNGDGSATYFGITGLIPKLKLINGVDDGGGLVLAAGNAWSEITLGNFEAVQGTLPDIPNIQPKWYMSRAFYYRVATKLANAAGGATAAELNGMGRRERIFLGDPVELVSCLPKTEGNSQVCALYGDLSMAATIGMRRGMTIATSREAEFKKRQVCVLGSQRLAISVEDLGSATEAGPVVGLITAAA